MKKIEKIRKILDREFKNPKIPLFFKNPYTLLIATILSANTQDITVNMVTPELFEKAPSPKKMLKLGKEKIKKIIKPCGLYNNKTKYILSLSKILVEKYNSQAPKSYEELEKLPGVGHKIAGIVLSYSFKQYTFPVDTHIKRCARRWGLTKEKSADKIERDLMKLFPKRSWKKLHLQIIYFGRKYCKAVGHVKERCPICSILK